MVSLLLLTTKRMIQGLGTLKLLTDIDQNKVVEDFKFTQFGSLEEADDRGKFYQRWDVGSFDYRKVKEILTKYYKELVGKVNWNSST